MLSSSDRKDMAVGIRHLCGNQSSKHVSDWQDTHEGTDDEVSDELHEDLKIRIASNNWRKTILVTNNGEAELIHTGPSSGRCDALGELIVHLEGVSPTGVNKSSLVVRSTCEKEDQSAASQYDGVSRAKLDEIQSDRGENNLANVSNGHYCLDKELEKDSPQGPVDKMTEQMQKLRTTDNESTALGLPILVGGYKRPTDMSGCETGRNQTRMNLTASVKYLESIGIIGVPVYGVYMEGPFALFSAAVVKGKYKVCTAIVYVLMGVVYN